MPAKTRKGCQEDHVLKPTMTALQLVPALLIALVAILKAAENNPKPNIILIISDDQGFCDYGFMGSKTAVTPNLDRLAAQSQLYTRGYSMPVCSPSLATLLTGLLPHQHGITGNDLAASTGKPEKKNRNPLTKRLLANPLILPKALTDAGYLTFQSGKLWNTTFKDVGFTHGMTDTAGRHGDAGLDIGRKGLKPLLDFMDFAQTEKKPFFVWYAPMLPHQPHNPPKQLLKKYTGRGLTPASEKYHAMVEWFDQTCGELDAYLTHHQLAENTVIVYLSDNGWDAAKAHDGHRSKLSPYELGIRTPIFVRWPAKLKPKRDETTLASIIDVVPTLLDIAGIEKPSALPGLNLMDQEEMKKRNAITIEAYTHDIADLADPKKSLIAHVVLSAWSKLLVPGPAKPDRPFSTAPQSPELFNLQLDPLETNNLATERVEEVKRLESIRVSGWHTP